MRILPFKIRVEKQPSTGSRLAVIEQSLEGQGVVISSLAERLEALERKAEATRRKVYRDLETSESEIESQGSQEVKEAPFDFTKLKPGDPVPLNIRI